MMKRSSPPCQDAAERLHSDPDYRLLHDQVMDLFVERMKSDIGKLKQNKLKLKLNDDVGNDSDDDVFVTEAAAWCVSAYPSEPLTNYYNLGGIVGHKRRDDKKYLEEIAAGNLSGIKYDDLLPHQIILYAEDGSDIKQAAELQWKTMVEGMHLKGKFRNYFAVYHTTKYADKGVGGRMMQDQPLLCPIQGKDLKYKCEFMGTMESDLFVDYEKLFDIPEVTAIAKGSVKPEQMIKTVFVFSESLRFSGIDESVVIGSYFELLTIK
ncbi:hypothetical protein ACFX19_015826 [Malus domestica]